MDKLLTAKQVAEKDLFPYSHSQLLKLAQAGKIPAYAVPGLGKRINWWFNLEELHDFFTKNGGIKSGSLALQKKPQILGSGLARRWT